MVPPGALTVLMLKIDMKYCAEVWQNCKSGISGVGVGLQLQGHLANAIFQRLGADRALLQALDENREAERRRPRAVDEQQLALRHARQGVSQASCLELAQEHLALGLGQ